MPVLVCEHCGGNYQVADDNTEQAVVCPHCKKETSCNAGRESGVGLEKMAVAYTQRVVARNQQEKPPWLAWLAPLVALVVTILCHAALVAIYVHFKPMSDMVVFWLPVAIGVGLGYGFFKALTASEFVDCPKWGMPLVVVVGIGLSALPILFAQRQYALKVRQTLIHQVNEYLTYPFLPVDTATCLRVSGVERMPDGSSTFDAEIKSGESKNIALTADVELFKAFLTYDAGMQDEQCREAESIVSESIGDCLEKYSHLAKLRLKDIKIVSTPKAGIYKGHLVFDNSLKLDFEAKSDKAGINCKLTPESHLRALAMPEATALWKRFDTTSTESCLDIELGYPVNKSVRNANLVLTSGDKVPVLIDTGLGDEDIRVFFKFREAAIVEINAELERAAKLKGEGDARKCVDVGDKKKLRNDEYLLRVLFPEGDPMMVLVRQDGYNLKIEAESYIVMLVPSVRSIEKSWSMLVPTHYKQVKGSEFVSTMQSAIDRLKLSMETKPVNVRSKFNLQEHAVSERTKLAESRPQFDIGSVTKFETTSGLQGYRYGLRRGNAMRIKYFFMHGGNLAIISGTMVNAKAGTEDKLDGIVKSLRFKDVVKED